MPDTDYPDAAPILSPLPPRSARVLSPAGSPVVKGVVFNLLEEAVTNDFGVESWEALLDDTGLDGAYTSLGNYDDAEVGALVAAASRRLGLAPAAVLRWFGERAMPLLRQRYASLFEGHAGARNFILGVNNIIHPEVRKLYAGAACPFFHFRENGDGSLVLRYQSTRDLIDLAHGFILGAAALWGETVHVQRHPPDGPDADVLVVRWA